MDAQQQIFSLMAAAEDQQKAVKTLLDALAAERAALASFKYNFKKRLREVLIVYPEASDCIEDDGECLRIKSTRLHVTRAPGKGARIGPPPT